MLPPPARTYHALGDVVLGPKDAFSRSGTKPPPQVEYQISQAQEKVVEVGEEEISEVRRKAKEKWSVVKNLFLKKENPDEQKEDMCGIIVTALPAAEGGYSIKMENIRSVQRTVQALLGKKQTAKNAADFDFGDSDNLIIQDLHIPEIEVTGPLQCSVTLDPGQVVALKLIPVDDKVDVALGMSVAPGAKTEAKLLKSGCHLITTTLAQCRGYNLAISNPTDKDIMYDFDFSGSANLNVVPHVHTGDPSVSISGMSATIVVRSGDEEINFVSLRTADRDRAVRLHYNMSEPSAPTKETLKCGATLITMPLKNCGGFLLSLQSNTDKKLSLQFDFGQSKNLVPKGHGSSEVNGMKVRVQLNPKQTIDPFCALETSEAKGGILMKYTLAHKEL